MAIYSYIRVSTDNRGQTTENQRKQIIDSGFSVNEFFSEDGVSGSVKANERPAFKKLMGTVKDGDTLIITMVDRLGRSASDILHVVEELKRLGIKLRVLQFDGMDITSSMGKMVLTCMAAMAELERNILIERTISGIARTKAQGTKLGPPLTIDPDVLRGILEDRPEMSYDQLASKYALPRNTIARNVTKWGGKLEEYAAEFVARKEQYARRDLSLRY